LGLISLSSLWVHGEQVIGLDPVQGNPTSPISQRLFTPQCPFGALLPLHSDTASILTNAHKIFNCFGRHGGIDVLCGMLKPRFLIPMHLSGNVKILKTYSDFLKKLATNVFIYEKSGDTMKVKL